MSATGSTNVEELLQLLDISDNILRYNSTIENNIRQNGGTVLYSYNNIIIASEISENLYNQLNIDSTIEYIESLPLKKYGEIDISLIDQLNVSKINNSSANSSISNMKNIINGVLINSNVGMSPLITNTYFTLSALTNEFFNYYISADGSVPITFEISTPTNYNGNLKLQYVNNINGISNSIGTYKITLTASNDYGTDTKDIILTISDIIKITNTNIQVYNKFGVNFSYSIESTGLPPKTYSIAGLPTEISLNNNILSGIFLSAGTYNMIMTVDGLTSSDSKSLTVYVDSLPIINSNSSISIEQNSFYIYNIIAYSYNDNDGVNIDYNLIGSLPKGMNFSTNRISGSPLETGIYNVTLIATNPIGQTNKQLIITVFQMGS